MSALKKSNLYDDVIFLTENPRPLKSVHLSNRGNCRSVWQKKKFSIPGFGNRTFKVSNSVTEMILRQDSETIYVEHHSQSFIATNGRKGAMYAEIVDWVSPTGENLLRMWKLIQKVTSKHIG